MNTTALPPIAGNRLSMMGARRRVSVIVAMLALTLLAGTVAATLYFLRSGSDNATFSTPVGSGLTASIFAHIPINEADENLAVAVAETSSDARVLEQVSADQARARNAAMRAVADVGPAAKPFKVPLGDGTEFVRAIDCMTTAIYYEAANEPLDGQRAVAQVIVNRSRNIAYPHSICGVVYQGWKRKTGCQFSFTCDGSLQRTPVPALWMRARRVANMALSGLVYAPVGLATHYHADYVLPYWAPALVKQQVIGRHIFYRWPGVWGTSRSFKAAYDAHEPDIWAEMRTAGIPGAPTMGREAAPSVSVDTASRPVLMAGGTLAVAESLPATGTTSKDRVYLMSRNTQQPAHPVPVGPGRGVTGGAIMPMTAPLPTKPLQEAAAVGAARRD